MTRQHILHALLVALISTWALIAGAAEEKEKEGATLSLADGKIKLQSPPSWKIEKPSSRIIEHELSVPAAEGDDNDGRMTMMGAGGSVEANIDRWIGQFSQPDGKATKERAKTKQTKIAGQEVHLVDISGTFKDQRGPLAPATIHKDYRMLAAIVVTDKLGQYFIKFYGPSKTVAANEKAFDELLQSLKVQ